MEVLIIGMGRAGVRHAKTLYEDFGIVPTGVVEPYVPRNAILDKMPWLSGARFFGELPHALGATYDFGSQWDIAVICSPPLLHVKQATLCLYRNRVKHILIEKPVCGRGQLVDFNYLKDEPNSDRIMVAYNYRFNPDVFVERDLEYKHAGWTIYSEQHRPSMPVWGIVWDHLPHDIDNLIYLSGQKITDLWRAETAISYYHENKLTWVKVHGKLSDGNVFNIEDRVSFVKKIDRTSFIWTPDDRKVMVTPNKNMFINMWSDFLTAIEDGRSLHPNLLDVTHTEETLQKIGELL